jgi:hypothetical protein
MVVKAITAVICMAALCLPAQAQDDSYSPAPPWQRSPAAVGPRDYANSPARAPDQYHATPLDRDNASYPAQQPVRRTAAVRRTDYQRPVAENPAATEGYQGQPGPGREVPYPGYYGGPNGGCGCSPDGPCDDCGCQYGQCWRGPLMGWPWPCESPLHNRLYASGDYVLYWTQGQTVPALVTTSSQASLGVLGQSDTVILFGDGHYDNGAESGAQISLGYWLDAGRDLALETTYLTLGKQTDRFHDASTGDPLLALPYYNIRPFAGDPNQDPHQDSTLIANTATSTRAGLSGTVDADASSEFDTLDVVFRHPIVRTCNYEADFVAGYRYAHLGDEVATHTVSTSAPPTVVTLDVTDRFRSLNEYNGAVLGLTTQKHWRRWTFGTSLKMSLGETRTIIRIDGLTLQDGVATTVPGGLLALQSNIGRHDDTRFTMVPEMGATLGWDITQRLKFTTGYSLFYWSGVARAGEQINLAVNPNNVPPPLGTRTTPPAPAFVLKTSDYWAQGLNLGLTFNF